ncbi:Protein of unknown function [Paramicrobacterium humi]|uniref:DUF2029 domain-containing protein n=1 Tax=Paramicrobacterium humi TaxID=640635 RepID=A0A1H4P6A2_9MICO|nr:glycosyltransferase 87 family protein [Microbacterium humi]SEC02991.1 Protein of unknown function [Microbacterium humi]
MRSRIALWAAFLAAHLVVAWLCLHAPGLPLGDVTLVYGPWLDQAFAGGPVVGIDLPWVYPLLAIAPMAASALFGMQRYGETWLLLVTGLDAIAFAVLLGNGRSRPRRIAAWWWTVAILLLGPIALARIDAVTVPIAIVGGLLALRRPRLAGALLAIVTWMKVWPAAMLAGLVIASRRRWAVVGAAAVVSAAVVVIALVLGGGRYVLSFLGEQTGRGLQLEAPISTVYLWQAAFHVPGAFIYYDRGILTYQVTGADVDIVIALATPLLVAATVVVVLIGLRAARAGAPVVRLLPELVLGLVLALIVFNKVGSPQFMVWLFAPVILGLVLQGSRFAAPGLAVLGLALLTHIVYPYWYGMLLGAHLPMVIVLTVRNLGYVLLLAWSLARVWRCGSAARALRETADSQPA